MAQYTTPTGVCHGTRYENLGEPEGRHDIDDAPAIDNVGYEHPTKMDDELYESDGKASHRYTKYRLCRADYLKAFADSYPGTDLPAI